MIADVAGGVRQWWAPLLAFAAGVVSFASPCVLPLVPGYLSFVTGERAVPQAERRRLLPVLAFILGFTVVFTVLFGFTASALSRAIKSTTGQRVAGGGGLPLGLVMILYPLRARPTPLYLEERPPLSPVRPGPARGIPP